jgi:hypothetical protein
MFIFFRSKSFLLIRKGKSILANTLASQAPKETFGIPTDFLAHSPLRVSVGSNSPDEVA